MTSSFGISPQRQLRETFERPEEQAKPAAPAQPTQTPLQRGGQTLDFQGYQEDIALKQRVSSIADFVEAGTGITKLLVEKEAKRQVANAARAYDQAAAYEADTAEIGEAAKILRKQGQNALADQVVSTNPWFRYGWLKKKSEHAPAQTILHTQDWLDTNMRRLEQIEDPAEVTFEINNQVQKYYKKNYPDIPNNLYEANVAPVLAKAVPQLRASVLENHQKWKINFAKQEAFEGLFKGQKTWAATYFQSRSSSANLAATNQAFAANLLKTQADYLKKGFTKQQFITNVVTPYLKAIHIDADDNGVNDIAELGLSSAVETALNIKMPENGQMLFDLLDPESGVPLGRIYQQAKQSALISRNQFENAQQQLDYRESTKFMEGLEYTLDRELAGLTGAERSLRQRQLYKQFEDALETGKPVSLFVKDLTTGQVTQQSVKIPYGVSTSKLIKKIFTTGAPADPIKHNQDLIDATTRLALDPTDTLSDLLEQYEYGSTEYKALQSQALKARTNFSEKQWTTETNKIKNVAALAVTEANSLDLNEKLSGVNSVRATKQIKAQYREALKLQKLEAQKYAERYTRSRINQASAEELKDPNWWTSLEKDVSDVIKYDETLNNTEQFLPGKKRTTADSLFAETRNAAGEVIDATRLLNNENFLRLNKGLFKTNTLQNYYKTEPMFSSVTANNIANVVQSNQGSFTPEALAELRDGFALAKTANSAITLPEFLKGQFGKNVYGFYSDKNKTPLKFRDDRIKELQNRLATTATNRSTEIQYDDLNHGSRGDGAIDFRIRDKRTGSYNVHFNAPVLMRIRRVAFASGDFGRYSEAEVLQPEGGLKKGDLLRIGHAKGFGNLTPGQLLYPGQLWGYQHTPETYRIGVDQAAVPGAGLHLHVDILRNGVRLSQAETRRIFKDILVKRLAP